MASLLYMLFGFHQTSLQVNEMAHLNTKNGTALREKCAAKRIFTLRILKQKECGDSRF